jgi:hypothetical protein
MEKLPMIVNGKVFDAHVWRAWGLMDALYLLWYMVHAVIKGKVPYVDDYYSAAERLQAFDWTTKTIAAVGWALELSILVSCVLFLSCRRSARIIAWCQMPFRLLLFVPSVSVLFMGTNVAVNYGVWFAIALLVLSEGLKAWTLLKVRGDGSLR